MICGATTDNPVSLMLIAFQSAPRGDLRGDRAELACTSMGFRRIVIWYLFISFDSVFCVRLRLFDQEAQS